MWRDPTDACCHLLHLSLLRCILIYSLTLSNEMKFVQALQKCIKEKKKYKVLKDGQEVPIDQATHISLYNLSYAIDQESGYKEYSVGSVIHFYVNMDMEPAKYLQHMVDLNMQSISFVDRKDLKDFLMGGSSQFVDKGGQQDVLGFDLAQKQRELGDDVLKDVQIMEKINSMTRTINTRTSILCVPKNFTQIQTQSMKLFVENEGKNLKRKMQQPTKDKQQKKRQHAIIIVPAGAQSLISLYNVKDFLLNKKFIPSQTYRDNGEPKPLKVSFKIDDVTYDVYDAVDTFSSRDWEQVVVVFTNGQEWQFKGWKWDKPVDIFHRFKGFFLKYHDEPNPGQTSQWKVSGLNIHRHRRNLDAAEVFKFWKLSQDSKLDHIDPADTKSFLEQEKSSNLDFFNGDVGAYLFGSSVTSPDFENTIKSAAQQTPPSDGFAHLLTRSKQSIASSKEAAQFLKKRAQLEDEYGKQLQKMSQTKTEGKGGSYARGWSDFGKLHIKQAEQRIKFAVAINEIAENISVLARNTERSRKQLKEAGQRHQKEYQEAEGALEKARGRFENASEDLQRAQGGEQRMVSSPKNLNPFSAIKNNIRDNLKLVRSEEETRQRATQANEQYKLQLQHTNSVRQTFFKTHLPRLVRGLKETIDDCDNGLQRFLGKYAHVVETFMVQEASLISPLEGSNDLGLIATLNQVDTLQDFSDFVGGVLQGKRTVDKSDHSYVRPSVVSLEVPPSPAITTTVDIPSPVSLQPPPMQSFGINLEQLMALDPDESPVPKLVENVVKYIEKNDLASEGLYRISGSGAQIAKIRTVLGRNPSADLTSVVDDVHAAAGLLKLFFRELPDPVFPRGMYLQLIEAARIEDERMRLIQVHELVNSLSDANYATLRFLVFHLAKVAAQQEKNKMSEFNLGIVWGPTLIDSSSPPDPSELTLQSKVVETILLHYAQIFDTE
ncbi:hypothetical protein EDD86DRAFT_277914 [Gorgonomyces haynaldii]|nr:hypothetical protein EDD86DRAFT_277914 [Gorgonomyces haynaldii]